ncbi:MAG: DUF4982 domain-containing protein, partial [Candidatus Didemnitutus sp.]|nr:DUF4982 domain-containing protein [Candidatus Didemnitutus sp.]
PFGFDLTPHLVFDQPNVLAVMVDNRFMRDPLDPGLAPQAATTAATHPNLAQLSRQLMEAIPESLDELQADQIPWNNPHWHPPHGGIYRNVRLHVTDLLHITLPLYSFLETEGPYAYATEVTAESARLGVDVPVHNERLAPVPVRVAVQIVDADGAEVFSTQQEALLAAGERRKFTVSGNITRPRGWEPASPHVYRVVTSLLVAGEVVDAMEVPLGIRRIEWSATNGLRINGNSYKLHGWGQKSTNEWPGLGAALPDWLHAYTLSLMKEAGGNFVRWGHVPGGPAQISAADHLGLVTLQPGVDGEHDTKGGAWALRAATFRDVIVYYRNHPAIFIWEGGNQKVSREHAAELRGYMDQFDPHGGRAYAHRRADAVTAEFMDVGIGTEGGREIARLAVIEGEYNREESPRRVWDNFSPPNFGYPEAKGQTYQLTSEQFAVNQVTHYVNKLLPTHHAGGANWIFSDSTSGGRVGVEVARTSGEVDGVRLPKEAYYVCQVMFTYAPRVHIIGHWSYPPGTTKTVSVVGNTGGEIELRLNGKPIGRAMPQKSFLYQFPEVAFAAGTLEAVALDQSGNTVAAMSLRTAGPPVRLRLSARVGPDGWRADGADIALFDVEAIDEAGLRVPTFQQPVTFAVEGPAVWRGGYNSGRIGSINHLTLELEAGINRVALRSTPSSGTVSLEGQSAGLAPARVSVVTRPAADQPPAQLNFPAAFPEQRQPQPLLPSESSPLAGVPSGQVGRFTRAFNYSGPAAYIVHVETNASPGRSAYVDADAPFPELPKDLLGADWVQASNRDALYHAVDLIELSVAKAACVLIAHDDRLPRPSWLLRDYLPTDLHLNVLGAPMSVFQQTHPTATSFTLGPNTDDSGAKTGNMYLVFVTGRR